jgi:RNA polymerase sigma-70 factor, ECF subfamily
MTTFSDQLTAERDALFGFCYRMSGNVEDADELVQDTCLRALDKEPNPDRPLRPWLFQVAQNLCRDRLRRRQHAAYTGPWLPSPLPMERIASPTPSAEVRYAAKESVSLAFLVAMEALTPKGRALLLLRDVYGYDTQETADLLDMSGVAVRTGLKRARATMAAYDARGYDASGVGLEKLAVVGKWLAALSQDDVAAAAALLAEDVVSMSDGGGEFFAAGRPLLGPDRVAKTYAQLAKMVPISDLQVSVQELNGMVAVLIQSRHQNPKYAPRVATVFAQDETGRILNVYSVLATRKLAGIGFPRFSM